MRRRNSVRNSESPLVCARRHRQMTMKCAYSSVEFQCSVPWAHGRHCTRASRGLVDVKPRKQIICNPRFEREIKLVRLQLNSNYQYFAISNQLAKQKYPQSQVFFIPCQWEEIVIIQVCGERISSEIRMKRKRLSPTKKARSKRRKASGEKPSRKLKRTPKKQNTAKGTRKENKK